MICLIKETVMVIDKIETTGEISNIIYQMAGLKILI